MDLSSLDVDRARKHIQEKPEENVRIFHGTLILNDIFRSSIDVCYGEKNDQRYKLNAATEECFQFSDNMEHYKVRVLLVSKTNI